MTNEEIIQYDKIIKMITEMKKYGWKSSVFHTVTPAIRLQLEAQGYQVSPSGKFVSWFDVHLNCGEKK